MTSASNRAPVDTTEEATSARGVAILASSAVCGGTVLGSSVPLNLTGVRAVRPVLLTPASYSQIEQTLLKLNQPPQQQQQLPSTTVERNMAIKRNSRNVENSDSDDATGDDSMSGDGWGSTSDSGSINAKTARTDVAVDYSIASSSHSSTNQSAATRPANSPRRHTGPRKPRVGEKLTPEEEERRRTRRERNKYAAAKCRQKRVDLTNQLLEETEKLESEQAKLQDDIKAFQREKDELEFVLEAHRLHCGIGQSTGGTAPPASAVSMTPEIKVEPPEGKVVVVVAGTLAGSAPVSSSGSALLSADSASSSTTLPVKSKEKGGAPRRPNSLVTPRLIGSAVSVSQVTGPQVAGVSITTPSAGINVYTLGLESMLDGHTGLTPITGLPVSLTGLSTPIFAIPASIPGIPVEETTPAESAATSSTTSSTV